jgi:hypothetical protein
MRGPECSFHPAFKTSLSQSAKEKDQSRGRRRSSAAFTSASWTGSASAASTLADSSAWWSSCTACQRSSSALPGPAGSRSQEVSLLPVPADEAWKTPSKIHSRPSTKGRASSGEDGSPRTGSASRTAKSPRRSFRDISQSVTRTLQSGGSNREPGASSLRRKRREVGGGGGELAFVLGCRGAMAGARRWIALVEAGHLHS